jgi:HAD superfamily hydrolase (TIGR01509 family)
LNDFSRICKGDKVTSSPSLIKAVLFDVDGVVVESELLHWKTFNEILESYGVHISESEWKTRFVGAGSNAIVKTLFQENDIHDDPAQLINQRRLLYKERVEKGELHAVPGFLEFYNSVQQATIPVAFVSTGHPINLKAALTHLGLFGKHPIIDVTKVTKTKPNPEAYLLGAETLSVLPQQCLVFEDSPVGVTAAKSANMTCVALTTTNPSKDLAHADLIIPNFCDLTIQVICEKLGIQIKV